MFNMNLILEIEICLPVCNKNDIIIIELNLKSSKDEIFCEKNDEGTKIFTTDIVHIH